MCASCWASNQRAACALCSAAVRSGRGHRDVAHWFLDCCFEALSSAILAVAIFTFASYHRATCQSPCSPAPKASSALCFDSKWTIVY